MYSTLKDYSSFTHSRYEHFNDKYSKKNSITAVSCFYQIKNKHDNKYLEWFKHSLLIQCPYIIFGTKETIDIIRNYREGLDTKFIECDINEFKTYIYKDNMQENTIHCPSIELNLIWNEKLFFMEKAINYNYFDSDYFIWIDAGICVYRDIDPPNIPFPNIDLLKQLPKDKLIVSTSNSPLYDKNKAMDDTENYHYIAGTSYLLHKSFFPKMIEHWKTAIHNYLSKKDWKYSDQVILTKIYNNHPELFHILCHGYGEVVPYLYKL